LGINRTAECRLSRASLSVTPVSSSLPETDAQDPRVALKSQHGRCAVLVGRHLPAKSQPGLPALQAAMRRARGMIRRISEPFPQAVGADVHCGTTFRTIGPASCCV
jgi:hypothetical protein